MAPCNRIWRRDLIEADCAIWPSADRQRWLELFAEETPLRRRPWVRETAYQNAGVYSRYLTCARRHGLDPRLSDVGVRAFIWECESLGCSAHTTAGYVAALYKTGRLLRPDADLEWLLTTMKNVDRVAARTPKQKNAKLADARLIYLLGCEFVEQARSLGPASWRATQLYRTGLFLCLGVCAPERLRALHAVRLDEIVSEFAQIHFPPDRIKTKDAADRVYPDEVRTMLQEWVEVYRHRWQPRHDALWIAKGGKPAGDAALVAAMRKATKHKFGFGVTPHRLRDGDATFITREAPERAALATIILGQKSAATTEHYTETAGQIEASRQAASLIDGQRDVLAKKVRSGTRSTIALSPAPRRRPNRNGRTHIRKRDGRRRN